MTHEELVEKVARAICPHAFDDSMYPHTQHLRREAVRTNARAALAAVYEALREPSEEMMIPGCAIPGVSIESGRRMLLAMLSASPLKEPGK